MIYPISSRNHFGAKTSTPEPWDSNFTNHLGNTLFDKFKGIREGMISLHSFHAVVGYFRSSGYFKIRLELGDIQKVQILIGINIDNIFRSHNKNLMFMVSNNIGDKIHDEAIETIRCIVNFEKVEGFFKFLRFAFII